MGGGGQRQSSYAAGGVPLAFKQEDFLVVIDIIADI